MNKVLRASKSLKYLALLIFCVEVITPVFFFSSLDTATEGQSHNYFQNHKQSTVALATLIAEESFSEGEKEGGKSKDQVTLYNFQFRFSFWCQNELIKNAVPLVSQNELYRVSPSLHKLYCVFLI